MATVEEFCQEIIADCLGNLHFARQAVSADDAVLKSLADKVEEAHRKLPGGYRILRADADGYESFGGLVRGLLDQLYDDPKFQPSDLRIPRNQCETLTKEESVCQIFSMIMRKNLKASGLRVLILLERGEQIPKSWTGANMGWMRGLMCDSQNLSILLLGKESIKLITGEPIGSSPFANIFDVKGVTA